MSTCKPSAEKLPEPSVQLNHEFSSVLSISFGKSGHLAYSLHVTDNGKGAFQGQMPCPRPARAGLLAFRDLLGRQRLSGHVQIGT